MKRNRLTLFFACCCMLFTGNLLADQLALPSTDIVAPEVKHELIKDPINPEKDLRISATVTDNVGVKSVLLFYRISGNANYKRAAMIKSQQSVYYYNIPAEEISKPGMEYYIQAEDLAGNTLLQGHSISPMVAKVSGTASADEKFTSSKSTSGQSTSSGSIWKNKWLWVGVGALVGGVALAAGGGGGDGGGATRQDATITVTAPTP